MRNNKNHRFAGGFTLTELMIVIGLITLLISMLLPALGKVRAAANSTACTSNLRQMGVAWSMYVNEHRGHLPYHVWWTPTTPENAWQSYWPGILDRYGVRGESLLCPSASEAIPFNQNMGAGNVAYAWNGKFAPFGSVMRFSFTTFRVSSFGYNRYLTVDSFESNLAKITSIKQLTEVPLFFDCVYLDAKPDNNSISDPVSSPPNLRGENFPSNAPDHWKFLIARHGKGINVCMADGSVRWVPLGETYQMIWKSNWNKYQLTLPVY